MQKMWSPRSCWAMWAIATVPLTATMKLTQELNTSAMKAESIVSSYSSKDSSHRINASWGFIGDFVSDVADEVGSTVDMLVRAGLTVGTVTANAAVVVGNQYIRNPTLLYQDLSGSIKDAVRSMKSGTFPAMPAPLEDFAPAGQLIAQTGVRLRGVMLEHANKMAGEGRKLGLEMGHRMLQGLPITALNCIVHHFSLCELLIGHECDCSHGRSYVRLGNDGQWVEMQCTYTKTSDFTTGFGITASVDSNGDTESGALPGTAREREAINDFNDMVDNIKKSMNGPGAMQKQSPPGSCEAGLEVAIDGISKFTPVLYTKAWSNGDTRFDVQGTVLVSYETMVSGQGSCSYTLTRGVPKKPITKVICAAPFCILISLQMVATLVGEGVLTGTIHMRNDAEFSIRAHGTVKEDGSFNVYVDKPTLTRNQDQVEMAASAAASLKLSVGPELVVWPMPGIPLTFHPTLNAEARAQGTIEHAPSTLLLETSDRVSPRSSPNSSFLESQETRSSELPQCGAAAVSVYSEFGIEGFGLPRVLRELPGFIKEKLREGMEKGVEAWRRQNQIHHHCFPGADLPSAPSIVADIFGALIPGWPLGFDVPSFQLLPPQRLFCKRVWETPAHFEQLPCAEELGCETAGQGPPKSDVVAVPPEQVETPPQGPAPSAHQCQHLPVVGDRFIQIGKFRIAALDDDYLTISHQDGHHPVSLVVSKNTADTFPFHRIPAGDRARVTNAGSIWDRQHVAKDIEFGFKYIQIGKFRLGDWEGWHFSIAHVDTKRTCVLWRDDGHMNWDVHFNNVLDRFVGAPAGISIGWKFLQIGNFRFGESGDHLALQFGRYRDNGDWQRRTLQSFHSLGGSSRDRPWDYLSVFNRPAAEWPCKNIGKLAYGECKMFGSWGDRFLQLGNWRLAALDADHFSISHKDGQNAIYKSNGHFYWKRTSDRAWRRPLGFPHGIVFGSKFVQIGQWRLAAMDDDHMSISHQNGLTNRLFVAIDGAIIDRPGATGKDWNAWRNEDLASKALSAGISGVGYGDRFLQIGHFRLGVGEFDDLLVSHKNPTTGFPRTFQVYQKSGDVLGQQPEESHHNHVHLVDRHAQWHCGNIQSILGSCPGITAGNGFIQLGSWRLAAIDSWEFSISHLELTPIMSFTSDGRMHRHSGTTSWDREARYVAPGELGEVTLGDRYIQFGKYWRIGQATDNDFSISHVDGKVPVVFHKDGVTYPHEHSGFDYARYNLWNPPHEPSRRHVGEPSGIGFGDGFVQIGDFRIGDVDHARLSVANAKTRRTSETFKKDGHTADSGSTEWTTLGRPFHDCQVIPYKDRNFTTSPVAFYNPLHGRWLQMNKGSTDMSASADQRAHGGPFSLRLHWTYERFAVVDVGNGEIGLHNTLSNRFVKMEGSEMMVSSVKDVDDFEAYWDLERFRIVDGGDGMVALYHPRNNRFVTMQADGHVRPSGIPPDGANLPGDWSWERFYMMPVRNFLEPDTLVALYSDAHGRFLRMYDHGGHCDMDSSASGPSLPDAWTLERFRVVDAGNGMVALHSHAYNKYVLMDDHFNVGCSAHSPTGSSELPNHWGWEAFVPVPMAFHAHHLEIALWHATHHRAIRMNHHIVDASPYAALQDLAMNTVMPWEKFRVVLLADPMT
ncbi:unnamed protein product [Symbiodinium sp. CCMP2592]|nr:unnamed protein product [Symbiodinium sp. CCMP2592]